MDKLNAVECDDDAAFLPEGFLLAHQMGVDFNALEDEDMFLPASVRDFHTGSGGTDVVEDDSLFLPVCEATDGMIPVEYQSMICEKNQRIDSLIEEKDTLAKELAKLREEFQSIHESKLVTICSDNNTLTPHVIDYHLDKSFEFEEDSLQRKRKIEDRQLDISVGGTELFSPGIKLAPEVKRRFQCLQSEIDEFSSEKRQVSEKLKETESKMRYDLNRLVNILSPTDLDEDVQDDEDDNIKGLQPSSTVQEPEMKNNSQVRVSLSIPQRIDDLQVLHASALSIANSTIQKGSERISELQNQLEVLSSQLDETKSDSENALLMKNQEIKHLQETVESVRQQLDEKQRSSIQTDNKENCAENANLVLVSSFSNEVQSPDNCDHIDDFHMFSLKVAQASNDITSTYDVQSTSEVILLRREIALVCEELEKCQEEKCELGEKYTNKMNIDMHNLRQDFQNQVNALKAECDFRVAHYHQTIVQLGSENEEFLGTLQKQIEQINELEQRCAGYHQLQADYTTLKVEYDSVNSNLNAVTAELHLQQKQCDDFKELDNLYRREKLQRQEDCRLFELKLYAAQQEKEVEIEKVMKTHSEVESEKAKSLEEKCLSLSKQYQQMLQTQEEALSKEQNLRVVNTQLLSEVDSLSVTCEKLEQTIEELKILNSNATSAVTKLENKIAIVSSDLEACYHSRLDLVHMHREEKMSWKESMRQKDLLLLSEEDKNEKASQEIGTICNKNLTLSEKLHLSERNLSIALNDLQAFQLSKWELVDQHKHEMTKWKVELHQVELQLFAERENNTKAIKAVEEHCDQVLLQRKMSFTKVEEELAARLSAERRINDALNRKLDDINHDFASLTSDHQRQSELLHIAYKDLSQCHGLSRKQIQEYERELHHAKQNILKRETLIHFEQHERRQQIKSLESDFESKLSQKEEECLQLTDHLSATKDDLINLDASVSTAQADQIEAKLILTSLFSATEDVRSESLQAISTRLCVKFDLLEGKNLLLSKEVEELQMRLYEIQHLEPNYFDSEGFDNSALWQQPEEQIEFEAESFFSLKDTFSFTIPVDDQNDMSMLALLLSQSNTPIETNFEDLKRELIEYQSSYNRCIQEIKQLNTALRSQDDQLHVSESRLEIAKRDLQQSLQDKYDMISTFRKEKADLATELHQLELQVISEQFQRTRLEKLLSEKSQELQEKIEQEQEKTVIETNQVNLNDYMLETQRRDQEEIQAYELAQLELMENTVDLALEVETLRNTLRLKQGIIEGHNIDKAILLQTVSNQENMIISAKKEMLGHCVDWQCARLQMEEMIWRSELDLLATEKENLDHLEESQGEMQLVKSLLKEKKLEVDDAKRAVESLISEKMVLEKNLCARRLENQQVKCEQQQFVDEEISRAVDEWKVKFENVSVQLKTLQSLEKSEKRENTAALQMAIQAVEEVESENLLLSQKIEVENAKFVKAKVEYAATVFELRSNILKAETMLNATNDEITTISDKYEKSLKELALLREEQRNSSEEQIANTLELKKKLSDLEIELELNRKNMLELFRENENLRSTENRSSSISMQQDLKDKVDLEDGDTTPDAIMVKRLGTSSAIRKPLFHISDNSICTSTNILLSDSASKCSPIRQKVPSVRSDAKRELARGHPVVARTASGNGSRVLIAPSSGAQSANSSNRSSTAGKKTEQTISSLLPPKRSSQLIRSEKTSIARKSSIPRSVGPSKSWSEK